MNLHILIIQLGTGIIVITFLVALLFRKKEKPGYFKYIEVFIFLGLLISLNSLTLGLKYVGSEEKINLVPAFIQELLIISQYLCLYHFIYALIKKTEFLGKIRTLMRLSIILFLLLLFISFWLKIDIRPSAVGGLFILGYCYFYVKDLMSNKPTLELLKSPEFWITSGIFFYATISTPVTALVRLIPKDLNYINIRMQLFAVFNVSSILLYLSIIKGYICLKHQQSL